VATGVKSLRVASRLNTLSFTVETAEAIALLERAMRISIAAVGAQRLETASIQMNLAIRMLDSGQAARALQLASGASATFAETLGSDHPRTVACRTLRDRAVELKRITDKK
jgi:hypothetical protein